MHLFKKFLELLFPPRADELLVRTHGKDGLCELSAPLTLRIGEVSAIGLLPYRNNIVRAFIREAKFHKSAQALQELSTVLIDHLLERVADEAAFGKSLVLIPVPLGSKRRKERGYNQIAEVCRLAIHRLGSSIILMEDALIRVKETLPQTELSGDARRRNMQGAFSTAHPLDPALSYVLIDDVVTTGATLLAGIQALRDGGAKNISAVAIAH